MSNEVHERKFFLRTTFTFYIIFIGLGKCLFIPRTRRSGGSRASSGGSYVTTRKDPPGRKITRIARFGRPMRCTKERERARQSDVDLALSIDHGIKARCAVSINAARAQLERSVITDLSAVLGVAWVSLAVSVTMVVCKLRMHNVTQIEKISPPRWKCSAWRNAWPRAKGPRTE